MKLLCAFMCAAFALPSVALEARDVRGLDVVLEPIPEPVLVDGLGMHIRVASGADVPRLAARIEQRWRTDGSVLRHHTQGPWKLVSRLVDGRSEVIQWHAGATSARLLHSVVDVMQAPARPTSGPFMLPPRCAWGRVVEGVAGPHAYVQQTARCQGSPASLQAALPLRLGAQGWKVKGGSGPTLQVARAGVEAQLIVAAGTMPDESALVWLSARRLSPEGR